MTLEEACKLGGTNRAGAITKGYIDDARNLEAMSRSRLRVAKERGHPRTPEAIDVVYLAGAMWGLAGLWFVVWLLTWASDERAGTRGGEGAR